MDDKTENLNKKTLMVISTYVGGFLIGYLFNVFLARVLAPSEYGNFKVAEAFVSLGSILVLMGGSKAAAMLMTDDVLGGNAQKVGTYVWFYLKVIIVASISIFILSIIGHYFHLSIFEGNSYHPVLLATLTIPFSAAAALIGGMFLISKRLGWAFIPWRIGYPLTRLILCGVVFISTGSLDDITAVLLMSLTAVGIFIFQLRHAIRRGIISFSKIDTFLDQKTWLKVSIPLMFIVIIQILMNQVDIYMIEWMSGEEAVGHFAAAQTTSSLTATIKNSVYAFLAPAVVLVLKEGKIAMSALSRKYFLLLIVTVLPLSLIVGINSHSILTWFGHNTELTHLALIFLIAGNAIDAILGLSVLWLQYSGGQKLVINILTITLIANVVLNAILIPVLDVEGAAIATSFVKSISAIVFSVIVYKKYKVLPWGCKE